MLLSRGGPFAALVYAVVAMANPGPPPYGAPPEYQATGPLRALRIDPEAFFRPEFGYLQALSVLDPVTVTKRGAPAGCFTTLDLTMREGATATLQLEHGRLMSVVYAPGPGAADIQLAPLEQRWGPRRDGTMFPHDRRNPDVFSVETPAFSGSIVVRSRDETLNGDRRDVEQVVYTRFDRAHLFADEWRHAADLVHLATAFFSDFPPDAWIFYGSVGVIDGQSPTEIRFSHPPRNSRNVAFARIRKGPARDDETSAKGLTLRFIHPIANVEPTALAASLSQALGREVQRDGQRLRVAGPNGGTVTLEGPGSRTSGISIDRD